MGSLPAWCACAGDLRGRQSLAEDPFFKGGGVLLLWTGRAPKGHCWFSGQPGALAGATASCRFCSSLDRGFLQANLIPFTSPLLGSAPPQVNFFFFLVCGIQSSVSHASHPRPQGALPPSYQMPRRFWSDS